MLDTKNMSKLKFPREKLEIIDNEKEFDLIPKPSITYDEFMEKNKDKNASDCWQLWIKLNDKEKDDLEKHIYDDLLRLPKDVTKITNSFVCTYQGLSKTSLGHERNRIHSHLGDLYFKKYLIEKYNLDGFQLNVMEGN